MELTLMAIIIFILTFFIFNDTNDIKKNERRIKRK